MQKTIRKRVYDTETAVELARNVCGVFGDPEGYEEILYQAPEGHYFLYGRGGDASPYAKEKIEPMSQERAMNWVDTH